MNFTAIAQAQAVTASGDLVEIIVPSDAVLELHRLVISQRTDAGDSEAEMLPLSISRITGSPTSGSGGPQPTPRAVDGGSAASGCTVDMVNTTDLSGGTEQILWSESFNVQGVFDYHPVPEDRIRISPSTTLLVKLAASPADSVSFDISVQWAELGG